MSNLQSKLSGIEFAPVAEPTLQPPGAWVVLFGVLYPLAVIVTEFALRMCAEALLDPMPTYGHVLAVLLVPASNMLIWSRLQQKACGGDRWLVFANGAAIAIACFYTVLFLPLVPIAFVAILVGIGLLPLAPLVSLVCTLRLRRALYGRCREHRPPLLAGLAAGLALLFVLDIPAAATRLGMQWAASDIASERERGLTLLRVLGDDELLLRLCYGAETKPTGPLGALLLFSGEHLFRPRPAAFLQPLQAREVYYRVHGVPFNTVPAPFKQGHQARFANFQFDPDHGATSVGGRLKGLDIVSSRIDGSIGADDAVSYLEWTVEFRNETMLEREVRLQMELPPGGVVSRATLWVNGAEREAAYGGRSEVRAAYTRVAVQQRRDPLLVTTKGGDRILAQAFPVPRNGTIKFKIGITAPLDLVDASTASLTLPAIVDRNFSFAPGFMHSVWIESKRLLAASTPGLVAGPTGSGQFRVSGELDDGMLSRTRPVIGATRNAGMGNLLAQLDGADRIVQEIAWRMPQASPALMLVIDGSARVRDHVPKLIEALDAIPATASVGAMIALEPVSQVPLAPWSAAQKQAVLELLRSARFVGGQDNAPVLATALRALETVPNARLLWIHGPQPVSFDGSAALLEQTTARLSSLPEMTLYSVEPGPNEVLPDEPWAWGAHTLPRTASPAGDLSAYFARAGSATMAIGWSRVEAGEEGLAKGSDHIVRLWANERVLELMHASPMGNRDAAVALATQYHLVTPISGAVVLETKQQYDESRLTPVGQNTVPTVPEPQQWALALIACAALAWLLWHRRFMVAA
jgi:Vault protein inter-alpha-trypsin domain